MTEASESNARDEVLKRMLKMPPKPHEPLKEKPRAKKVKLKKKKASVGNP